MILTIVVLAALLLGLVVGLYWRGVVLLTDRQELDHLAEQVTTELRMQARTHATLRAMRDATNWCERPSGS